MTQHTLRAGDLELVGALDPQRITTTVCDVRDADALSAAFIPLCET